MKHLLALIFVLFSIFVGAQNTATELSLKNSNGEKQSFFELIESDTLIVVTFWATWCKPCITELDAISDVLEDWQTDAEFKFIAVSTDDSRSNFKVKSLVNGKGWDFQVLLDENQNLKRHFGINNIPYSLLLKNGKVVYRHFGYLPGDEELIWLEIQKNK